MDYVHIITRLTELQEGTQNTDQDAMDDGDADRESTIVLVRRIPKLLDTLPEVFHDRSDPRRNVALAKMISGLMLKLDKVQPLALVRALSPSTAVVVFISLFCRLCHRFRPMLWTKLREYAIFIRLRGRNLCELLRSHKCHKNSGMITMYALLLSYYLDYNIDRQPGDMLVDVLWPRPCHLI